MVLIMEKGEAMKCPIQNLLEELGCNKAEIYCPYIHQQKGDECKDQKTKKVSE